MTICRKPQSFQGQVPEECHGNTLINIHQNLLHHDGNSACAILIEEQIRLQSTIRNPENTELDFYIN